MGKGGCNGKKRLVSFDHYNHPWWSHRVSCGIAGYGHFKPIRVGQRVSVANYLRVFGNSWQNIRACLRLKMLLSAANRDLFLSDIKEIIKQSVLKLEKWVEDHDYKGYDPADGLTSYLRPLTFGNILLERILLQILWKSPINLRPLLGVKPIRTNIGMGYIAWGYLTILKATGDKAYKKKAKRCLQWLMEHKAPGFEQYSWGKNFDFVSRGGRQRKLEPITIWTSLIGHAFLDAYEITGEEKYFNVSESVCDWILERPRNQTDSGACINYGPWGPGDCTIHNQSMVAAAILARTARYNANSDYLDLAKQAITYTCSHQLPDGSWWYGEGPKWHWIDSFHTGYNLDSLKYYIESTGDKSFEENMQKGFAFFRNNFFESYGKPKYYHNRLYTVDSQCAAQAIETFVNYSDYYETAMNDAIKVALWTINNMQDPAGYFYYRKYPFITTKVPMIHWAQGTTFRALTILLLRLGYQANN